MAEPDLNVVDWGRCPYRDALARQEEWVAQRQRGEIGDQLVLVEHDPVYTLGRNARDEHVLASSETLAAQGVDLVRVGRGGDVTYHGPGQLVVYPIIDLGAREKRGVWYVGQLENLVMAVLADFGVEGATDRKNRGVWVGDKKIAALGVRVTRGVTMHGFAINVRVDLAAYDAIVPCGIRGKGVTSLDRLVSEVTMAQVKASVVRHADRFLCRASG